MFGITTVPSPLATAPPQALSNTCNCIKTDMRLSPRPLPLAQRRSLMFPDDASFLIDLFLTTRPLESARELIVLHQRPRIAECVWVEVVPNLVLRVHFSLACEACQGCASSGSLETRYYLPGWWVHTATSLFEDEYSHPQLRHCVVAFLFMCP
jgi:hypothetical protein